MKALSTLFFNHCYNLNFKNWKKKSIDDVKSMVSISLENSKKLESTSKENQAINKALNEVAHETIEDFIGQVKTDLISYWFLTISLI